MRPLFYLRRLREDVADWVSNGVISKEQGEAILARVGAAKGTSLAQLLVVLGAILAAAAAVTFVAANWEGMAKTARLALLLAAMLGAWGIAAAFFRRDRPGAGQAFVLLAIGLFGANINLVGQTYHLNADYPDGLMIWSLGALAAAAAIPSRTALGAALVLGGIWTFIETFEFTPGLHLPFAAFWLAAAALAYVLKWRGGAHLVALTALYWLAISLDPLADLIGVHELEILSWYGSFGLALFAWMLFSDDRPWRIAAHYGAFVFLAVAFYWHATSLDSLDYDRWREAVKGAPAPTVGEFLRAQGLRLIAAAGFVFAYARGRLPAPALAAGLAIVGWGLVSFFAYRALGPVTSIISYWVGAVAVIAAGSALGRRTLINLGLVAFGAGVLDLYFDTFRNLLDTSVMFLAGALLLFALAWFAHVAGKRLAARGAAQ
ncbi:MAG: DUF2157 domain-containing protein [Pseudomonadota bacterium]|nr:DUF2157 domain-containing protein [Pseudomonadota bacterium]